MLNEADVTVMTKNGTEERTYHYHDDHDRKEFNDIVIKRIRRHLGHTKDDESIAVIYDDITGADLCVGISLINHITHYELSVNSTGNKILPSHCTQTVASREQGINKMMEVISHAILRESIDEQKLTAVI